MKQVSIRHAEPDDYEAIHQILSGPRVMEGTLQLPFQSMEQQRQELSEMPEGFYHLVGCVEDELVGSLGLRTFPTLWRRRHVGEIGLIIRDDWQGKGIGSALMEAALELADNWLKLIRVELIVYANNAAGIALYKKFGFEIEGTHHRYAFGNGEYVDAYSMARIK